MKFQFTQRFFIELGASVFTLAGIYVGSSTLWGAVLYIVALAFWFWLMIGWKMWGLVPLNCATLVIASYHVYNNLWGG